MKCWASPSSKTKFHNNVVLCYSNEVLVKLQPLVCASPASSCGSGVSDPPVIRFSASF